MSRCPMDMLTRFQVVESQDCGKLFGLLIEVKGIVIFCFNVLNIFYEKIFFAENYKFTNFIKRDNYFRTF